MDSEPLDPWREGRIVQHWQLPFLGLQAFPAELTAFEIGYFFTFTATEREAIFSRYGEHHRLAAAIQIGWIKMTGCPLDAFETLPIAVLRHLGTALDIVPPELTSLRALYGRRSTLYEHQAWAAALLGFRPFTARRQRALARQVRREAHKAITLNRLVEFARRWLYERRILIPPDRRLRDLARTAYGEAEQTMYDTIHQHIPQQVLDTWEAALFTPHRGKASVLEW
jgi:hypothetical protein